MKIKIDKLVERTINTKYGEKQKLSISSNGTWYGAWKGPQCANWVEGMEVDVEVKERKYQDKFGATQTGYDIMFPKADGGYGYNKPSPVDMAPIMREIAEIKIMIEEIFRYVCTAKTPEMPEWGPPDGEGF